MIDVQPPPLTPDVALFLDFDGTLVDLAPTPDAVEAAPGLDQLIGRVTQQLNGAVAVITGRQIDAIDLYLNNAVRAVAGIHGAERRTSAGEVLRADLTPAMLDPARAALSAFSRSHDGVSVEDKGVSIALHFRAAPTYADACRAAVDACAAESQGRFTRLDGNMIVELKPTAIGKGSAMAAYMNESPFAGRKPVFVGDDITDESAFTAALQDNGLGIIVGTRTPTAATCRLPTVAALHAWLSTFDIRNDERISR